MSKPLLAVAIAGVLFLAGWTALSLWLPTNQATTEVTATIEFDGKTYSSKAVWRIRSTSRWGFPDSGVNYRITVAGDAVAFDLGNGDYVFLQPQNSSAAACASEEITAPTAVMPLPGPCEGRAYGSFIYASKLNTGTPDFIGFSAGVSGLTDGRGGTNLKPEVMPIANRGFRVVSMMLAPTGQPLATDMTERFPWILTLPRTDMDSRTGEYLGPDSYRWSLGDTYAQYFTTYLPTPSGAFAHSLAY